MNLEQKVDTMCAAALRRLHKAIDIRAGIAHGTKPETVRRSCGQLYRDRAKEAEQAELRG